MFAFIVRRIIQAVVVMLIISLVGFSIQHQIGDPIRDLVGERVTPAERAVIRDQLGLNDPFYIQYVRFVKNAARGDLGLSFFYKKPALEVIAAKAPATIELVIVLIYLFGVELNWLPSYGRGETVNLWGWESGFFTWDGLKHLVLPSVSLSSIMLPLFIRLVRAEMMEVLETEYIKFAWAKGLHRERVWYIHAFKNTLLPVITVFGVQLGILFAFTILTETVFQWQGMGFMFLEAVERSDTSLLVAYLVVVGAIFVVVNTIVDIVYGFVNPMVRIAGTK
jgi:peptide/nickel transport system permease protein